MTAVRFLSESVQYMSFFCIVHEQYVRSGGNNLEHSDMKNE